MSSIDQQARRRDELKAKGLCQLCGKNAARPGRWSCQGCADRRKSFHRQLKQRAEDEGLCVRCVRNPKKPGRTKCDTCLTYYRERYHAACARIGKTSSRRVKS